jgi:hypothetical protein
MKKTTRTQTKHEDIQQALDVLRAAGLKHFDEHAREHIDKYAAIGAALAYVEDNPLAVASLACEYWEEHNQHSLAALLRWAMPVVNQAGPVYLEEAERIQSLMEREHVVLLLEDGKAKGYTVRLVIEPAEVDVIASGYEWICPHCEHTNHMIEVFDEARCERCRTDYTANLPEHAYP